MTFPSGSSLSTSSGNNHSPSNSDLLSAHLSEGYWEKSAALASFYLHKADRKISSWSAARSPPNPVVSASGSDGRPKKENKGLWSSPSSELTAAETLKQSALVENKLSWLLHHGMAQSSALLEMPNWKLLEMPMFGIKHDHRHGRQLQQRLCSLPLPPDTGLHRRQGWALLYRSWDTSMHRNSAGFPETQLGWWWCPFAHFTDEVTESHKSLINMYIC